MMLESGMMRRGSTPLHGVADAHDALGGLLIPLAKKVHGTSAGT